jgi:ribonucleoside-diphosphate reductase alpha chain
VNVNDAFMQAAKENKTFTLKDGKIIQAKELLGKIADAAHQCGDPGLISIERLNNDNPTPTVSSYKTTAPCAEVGLAPGETCVFGYINLASFVDEQKQEIDFASLRSTVELMTRALDNILEVSIHRYVSPESRDIMQAKRKIGIGVCGFADLLVKLNVEYTEQKAQDILKEMLGAISYYSKVASVDLAKVRGSFTAIDESRYMDEDFILNKYGTLHTSQVSEKQWKALAQDIKTNKLLRHATITSLPPTGRSATVIGASQSIEPIFSLKTRYGLYPLLQAYLEKNKVAQTVIDEIERTGCAGHFKDKEKNPFMTATEISYKDHLAMVIAAQQAIDESVSKTVNVPKTTTPAEIAAIYEYAYDAGLKGTSVFRADSRTYQPKELSKSTE